MHSPLLLGLVLGPTEMALGVAVAVAAALIVAALVRKDTAIEDRRRSAIEVASIYEGYGLRWLPRLLRTYAVGDYSGLVIEMREMAAMLRDPGVAQAELEQVVDRVVEKHVADPKLRGPFLERVDRLRVAYGVEPAEE